MIRIIWYVNVRFRHFACFSNSSSTFHLSFDSWRRREGKRLNSTWFLSRKRLSASECRLRPARPSSCTGVSLSLSRTALPLPGKSLPRESTQWSVEAFFPPPAEAKFPPFSGESYSEFVFRIWSKHLTRSWICLTDFSFCSFLFSLILSHWFRRMDTFGLTRSLSWLPLQHHDGEFQSEDLVLCFRQIDLRVWYRYYKKNIEPPH